MTGVIGVGDSRTDDSRWSLSVAPCAVNEFFHRRGRRGSQSKGRRVRRNLASGAILSRFPLRTFAASAVLSSCRFSSASSRKTGLFSLKMRHFQVTLRDFGNYGQFDSWFDGSRKIAAGCNASHHGKRVYAPMPRQTDMLKYKG